MKRTLLTSLLLVSTCAAAASAENLDGSVTLGGSYTNIKGATAKANEYRTLGDGMFGNLDLDYRDKDVYTNFQGSLIITDTTNGTQDSSHDANMSLKAGVTDSFKGFLFYNEIPHNFTYGAKTFVNGVGTATLVKPTPGSNPTAASYTNTFDYSIKKRNMGLGGEVSFKTPLFFSLQADRSTTNGLMPFGLGTSLREYPAPIDFTTNNVYMQTGYRSNKLIFTVDGLISSFANENDKFAGWNSTAQPTYYGYLPPDNNYYKVGGSLMYKIPVMNSTLMARANYSMLRNDVTLFDNGSTGTFSPAQNWAGKVNYTTVSASLTSNPFKNLDTRVFVNFLNKKNVGPEDFNYGNATYTTERFDYSKRNVGVDVGYKLPAKTKLSAGYEFLNLHRAIRTDATSTEDNTFFVQAKNNTFDWMSAKVRYQRLMRKSNFADGVEFAGEPSGPVANTSDTDTSLYYKIFFRPADTADKKQDSIKAGLEFEPMHGLSVGVEYAYKLDDYTKNYLGIQGAKRHELYVDANYAASIVKLNAYADFEKVQTDSRFRQLPRATTPATVLYADPLGTSNTANFNWTTKRKDISYALGCKADVDIIKNKLNASLGYRYENANGDNDFSTNVTGVVFTNVNALDDYIKNAIDAKLSYNVTQAFNVAFGYQYEHLKYSDDAYIGYPASNIQGSNYLSGAYAKQNYDASLFYLSGTLKF
jgi:hypothetical protein